MFRKGVNPLSGLLNENRESCFEYGALSFSQVQIKGGFKMIKVTALDNRIITVNAELIERLEHVPETVITLVGGKKFMVKETMDEVINLVIKYRRSCNYPVIEEE